eukprot:730017-Rhodomonas_salina.1
MPATSSGGRGRPEGEWWSEELRREEVLWASRVRRWYASSAASCAHTHTHTHAIVTAPAVPDACRRQRGGLGRRGERGENGGEGGTCLLEARTSSSSPLKSFASCQRHTPTPTNTPTPTPTHTHR